MKKRFSFKRIKKRVAKELSTRGFLIWAAVLFGVSLLLSMLGVSLTLGKIELIPACLSFVSVFGVLSVFMILKWLIRFLPKNMRGFFEVALMGFGTVSVLAIPVFALIHSGFRLVDMNWGEIFTGFFADGVFWATVLVLYAAFFVFYYGFISREELRGILFFRGIRGKGAIAQIEANLENSRWMTDDERDTIFKSLTFSELSECKKDGVPIRATFDGTDDMDITFNSPCHSIIIGSTGSGKTTTFVNPMIQLLGASGAGSSMLITDPKGELLSLHSKFLKERGYDVKVLDLRDTYHSYRWNPLEPLWDTYQEYLNAENEAYKHRGDVKKSKFEAVGDPESFTDEWYVFRGKAYSSMDRLVAEVKIFRAQRFDEVYEDMNDLVSVLVPVQNQNDPMWEKGARSITMAVLLAMLEDSENPELGMTRERFNLFNMSKILQRSEDDYRELKNYFAGRDRLSKAVALSKQVLDAADKTRSSYMSVLQEKLSIFNDSGVCALTSASDFNTADLALKPTAIFVKIPDEKDTRHGLASIFMTNVYKSLIKLSTQYEDLSLPRNVYYILDEFGNMPKIEKFDKMITVGRSRKIWFNMIVQSYAQLNNVYGDTVADIVKGNCGIKMFIGSNDMGTCKEYSELCGNVTVVTQGSNASGKDNTSYSQSIQTRPLIYPSELQRLNNKQSSGNSIIVTFGNYPLKTNFTPSYKVPMYVIGQMDMGDVEGRLFEEDEVFYDIAKRNKAVPTPAS